MVCLMRSMNEFIKIYLTQCILISFRKLSNQRYKCVKSGNSIESVLQNQRSQYLELVKNLLNEKELYSTSDIISEKKKFFKTKDPKSNDVGLLRTSIKDGKATTSDNQPTFKNKSNLIKLTEVKKTTSSKLDQGVSKDEIVESSKIQCIII